jgi:hypothetical protein
MVKSTVEISQNFVAISEYMNFNWNWSPNSFGPLTFLVPRNLSPEKFGPWEIWALRKLCPKKFCPYMKIIINFHAGTNILGAQISWEPKNGCKLFWSGPNHFDCVQIILEFGQVQIRLFSTNFYNLDLSKIFWTRKKLIGPVQNNWYSTKMIWTVQNDFGPIEGQSITVVIYKLCLWIIVSQTSIIDSK